MIGEWLSYRLADFVMLSARVHDRQIELYNQDLLGMQVLSLGLGFLVLWLGFDHGRQRKALLTIVLGLAWIFVAWSFLWLRYGEVNLVARYAAPAFGLQGLAILAAGLFGKGLDFRFPAGMLRSPSIALVAASALLYPAFALVAGRSAYKAEFFAMMPDPTALATLAILAVSRSAVRYPLMIIPAAWCALSAATQVVLEIQTVWVLISLAAASALLAIIFRLRPERDRAQGDP